MAISLTPVTGNKWIRSNNASLSNPYNGIPTITFDQEVMASFADGTIASLGGINSVSQSLADPTTTINLVNPADGTTVLGTITYEQIYVMLYSLYVYTVSQHP